MPLKVNGIKLPYSLVVPVIVGLIWFGGLSYQVNANDTEIKKQAQTPIRLSVIETNLENQEKALDELKEEVKDAAKEQAKALKEILAAVKK